MSLLEQASGARMHTSLYRPFGLDLSGISALFFRELALFLTRAVRSLGGAFCGLLTNRTLRVRLSLVGQLSQTRVAAYGLTGLIARSAGVFVDGRVQPDLSYALYPTLCLRSYLGRRGDNFDRFLLRIKETVESFALLTQVLTRLQPFCTPRLGGVALSLMSSGWCSRARNEQWGVSVLGLGFFFCASLGSRATQTRLCVSVRGRTFLGGGVVRGSQGQVGFGSAEVLTAPLAVCSAARFRSMEALIAHFRAVSEGGLLTPGLAFRVVESPKGLVGVFIVSAGGVQPTRVHLRTPVGHNMHALASMAVDTLLGDFVMTFCSFDIVLGEIDR
jgi:NADH:ubiquinone oxidoreductase subunit D